MDRRAALVRLEGARGRPHRDRRVRGAARGAAAARARAGRGALRRGDARDLPGAARAAAGRRGLERAGDRRGRRADHLRRARRPGVRARAAAPDAQRLRGDRGGGHAALPLGRDGGRRARRDGRRAAGRRRAVELLDRVRRGADPEGVPARRARRRTPSSSCCASCPSAASRTSRSLAGWYEFEGRFIDATLGILQEYLAGARDGWELALEEIGVATRRGCSTGCASSAR